MEHVVLAIAGDVADYDGVRRYWSADHLRELECSDILDVYDRGWGRGKIARALGARYEEEHRGLTTYVEDGERGQRLAKMASRDRWLFDIAPIVNGDGIRHIVIDYSTEGLSSWRTKTHV